MTDKQQIKKEVVLQMIWDRHFDLGMEKDLDDICEDIYNEVFVLLLEKARKETAKEFLYELIKYIDRNEAVNSLFFGGKCLIDKETVNEIAKQFGVEVEQ